MSLVEFSIAGAIARVTLNRPEKLNAINAAMLGELSEALAAAEADDDVRALLLDGNGRAFSAGFDLGSAEPDDGLSREERIARELWRDFDLIMRFWDFPKPTVAAVHGYCLGSALEISAVCDITIAADGCRFGAPEVRFGSGMVCLILPWIIGLKQAKEILLVGSDRMDAERAARIGLVNKVVPPDELHAAAMEVAQELALNDAYAVRMTKKAIAASLEIAGLKDALKEALLIDIDIETTDTPESREFNRILEEQGTKAALAWRAGQVPGGGRDA